MREIPVHPNAVALVDDEDYERLSTGGWWISVGYASRHVRSRRKTLLMHREVLNAPDGMQVDHINGNRLDNRRCNLRLCTASQNNAARRISKEGRSSRYRGVHWCKRAQRFIARISLSRDKTRYIGTFECEIAAARAYDAVAREMFGEFASPNFPSDVEAFEATRAEERKAS